MVYKLNICYNYYFKIASFSRLSWASTADIVAVDLLRFGEVDEEELDNWDGDLDDDEEEEEDEDEFESVKYCCCWCCCCW